MVPGMNSHITKRDRVERGFYEPYSAFARIVVQHSFCKFSLASIPTA